MRVGYAEKLNSRRGAFLGFLLSLSLDLGLDWDWDLGPGLGSGLDDDVGRGDGSGGGDDDDGDSDSGGDETDAGGLDVEDVVTEELEGPVNSFKRAIRSSRVQVS